MKPGSLCRKILFPILISGEATEYSEEIYMHVETRSVSDLIGTHFIYAFLNQEGKLETYKSYTPPEKWLPMHFREEIET